MTQKITKIEKLSPKKTLRRVSRDIAVPNFGENFTEFEPKTEKNQKTWTKRMYYYGAFDINWRVFSELRRNLQSLTFLDVGKHY